MDTICSVGGKGNDTRKKTTSRKSVTVHRALTSDQCLELKKKELLEKELRKNEKEERKRKREQAQELKKKVCKKGSGTGLKGKGIASTSGRCVICYTPRGGDWVQCDQSKRWMHQTCVPEMLRQDMQQAIAKGETFKCHLCEYSH